MLPLILQLTTAAWGRIVPNRTGLDAPRSAPQAVPVPIRADRHR